jgi:hypothetical protein
MAMMHLCQNCGTDLAHRRARREPHYGLPIVRCPACARVAVRRRHPAIVWWRYTLRSDRSLRWLFTQIAVLGVLTAATIGTAWLLFERIQHPRGFVSRAQELGLPLGLVAVTAIVTGAWLTVGLGHWRRSTRLVTWTIWIVAWGVFATATDAMDQFHGSLADLPRHLITHVLPVVFAIVATLLGTLPLLLPGVLIGRFIRHMDRAVRRAMWRRRRHRFRQQRNMI